MLPKVRQMLHRFRLSSIINILTKFELMATVVAVRELEAATGVVLEGPHKPRSGRY